MRNAKHVRAKVLPTERVTTFSARERGREEGRKEGRKERRKEGRKESGREKEEKGWMEESYEDAGGRE